MIDKIVFPDGRETDFTKPTKDGIFASLFIAKSFVDDFNRKINTVEIKKEREQEQNK